MKTEIRNRKFLLFLLRAAVAAAVVLGVITGINYFVDACHVITYRSQEQMAKLALEGNIVATPENYDDRIFQMAVVDHMQALPETVVVGSSRGMYLGSEITGYENLYNSCIFGACLEDWYAVLGLYRQKFSAWPARIIFEVSPWTFFGDNPEVRWSTMLKYRTAAEKLYADINHETLEIKAMEWTPFGSEGKPYYSRENPYFSLAYFQYNCFTIRQKGLDAFRGDDARVSTDPSEPADYPDGSIRNAAESENESPERLAKVRAASGPVTYEDLHRMTEIDERLRKAFENLVQDLLDSGTEVILYLQPFSETQCRYSFDENLNPVFRDVESYLRAFAAARDIQLIGGYDARDYGLGDERFMDYMHLDKQGTATVWNTDF